MSNRARAAFKQSELRAVQEMAGGMAGMEPAGSYERGREALRAELVAAVEGLPAYEEHDETLEMDIYDPMGVYRAAVLRLIEATGKEPFE